MKKKLSIIAILGVMIVIISCKKYNVGSAPGNDIYSDMPLLPELPYNYKSSSNDHLAALGRVLFFDRNLSKNNSVSCGSCHQQSKAFCDNLQFSVGLENGKTPRNSPSIFAKSGRMFWDGRAQGLQELVSAPLKNHIEMKFENLSELAKKISAIGYYPDLFLNAFGSKTVDSVKIKKALAEFLLNFNFSNNKFNRNLKNQEALTTSEALGKELFFGKARCSNCHHLENQSNSFDTIRTGYGVTDMAFNIGLDKVYSDAGMGGLTKGSSNLDGMFMVPVLLNVEYTAPYMHDGRFKTLEQVVEHYNSGVQNHPNLSMELKGDIAIGSMTTSEQFKLFLKKYDLNNDGEVDEAEFAIVPPAKLNLSTVEKRNLVDFLKALSDPSIMTDVKFKDPFTSN